MVASYARASCGAINDYFVSYVDSQFARACPVDLVAYYIFHAQPVTFTVAQANDLIRRVALWVDRRLVGYDAYHLLCFHRFVECN